MMIWNMLLKYTPSLFEQQIEGREIEQEIAKNIPVYHLSEEDTFVPSLNGLSFRLGLHWSIVGKTGSGKTRFSLALLDFLRRAYPKVPRYVLNSTADDMPEIHAPITIYGNQAPDRLVDSTYTQVWVPDTDDTDQYNKWLLSILYARKPAIVLIDELASLSGTGKTTHVLEGYMKLLKQGRKHGITVISETQQLASVPLVVFRQMEYYVQFRINNDVYDTSTSRRYLDMDKADYHQPHAKYGFFLKRSGINTVKEYSNSSELFGAKRNVAKSIR